MTTRRGNLEGTIAQRKDGRYAGAIGWTDELGRKKRQWVYGKTKKEVREKLKVVRARLEAGKPATDSSGTLGAYAAAWITSTLAASDRKPSTKTLYSGLTRTHVIERDIGDRKLGQIKPGHIDAWIAELRDAGKAESTVRQVYTVLRAILDTAVRDDLLGTNPAAAVKRPRVTVAEAAYLTPPQIRELLAAASATRYAPLFELLVNTGLRRGEALALKWTDLDFTNGLLRVRGTLARVDGALVHGHQD